MVQGFLVAPQKRHNNVSFFYFILMEKFIGIKYATAKRFELPYIAPNINSVTELECNIVVAPQNPSTMYWE